MNLKNVPDAENEFAAIPAGMYLAKINKAEARKSKKDKDMYAVTYQITEGPETAPNKKYAKRLITEYFMLDQDWRMSNLKSLAIAAGLEDKQLEDFRIEFLEDHPIKVFVAQETRQDNQELTNKVVAGKYFKWEGQKAPVDLPVPEKKKLPFQV